MNSKIFLFAFLALAIAEEAKEEVKKNQKRGLLLGDHGFGGGEDHLFSGGLGEHDFGGHDFGGHDFGGSIGESHGLDLGGEHHIQEHDVKTITIEKKVPYPVPHHVPYIVKKPYPVHVPVKVPVEVLKPYPVEKHVGYPVEVKKYVPYPVEKHVPYPVKVPVKVPFKVPVAIEVPKPYPVEVKKHVPYPVKVPIIVEKKIPIFHKEHHEYGHGW